jgi:hypothetical protein
MNRRVSVLKRGDHFGEHMPVAHDADAHDGEGTWSTGVCVCVRLWLGVGGWVRGWVRGCVVCVCVRVCVCI